MSGNQERTQLKIEKLIDIRGLSRSFGQLEAVRDIHLNVLRGEIMGLVGPDGSGKTTVLRLLCGLMEPSAGTAEVSGINVHQDPEKIRDSMGYMPQRFGLYSDLSVEENLNFYADLFGLPKRERHSVMERLLKMTRMEPFTARPAGKLSGGMKQKLALSCALLHRPQILLLDEPTNGVDPISRRDFWTILYQLVKDGVTVLITTSYLDEAERCNRVALMYRGSLIDCDSPVFLRRRFEGRFFACQCTDRSMAQKLLKGRSDIISAEPAGQHLHVCVGEGIDMNRVLTDLPPEIKDFHTIRPSLEDVFIAMVNQEGLDRRKRSG